MAHDITSVHPAYSSSLPKISRCKDAYEGTDAIKEKTTFYLPQLGGQSKDEYSAYLQRALFFNATKRTVKGLVGSIMRKDPQMEIPKILEPFMENCDGKGTSFIDKLPDLIEEVLITGRVGCFIDRENAGGKPYLVDYQATGCTNWITHEGNLHTSIFKEKILVQDIKNMYKQVYVDQYREIAFVPGKGVVVRVWTSKDKKFKVTSEYFLSKKGKQLDILPVTYLTASGSELSIDNPPILDIVDINLSHYMSYADLEHGRHWTALPTPYFTGMDTGDDEEIVVGSGTAVILEEANAKAGFIEFTGKGLKALETALEHKEKQMAVLGAKMVEGRRDGVQAAETARINKSGEVAALSEIAKSISAGVIRLLRKVAYWEGVKENELKNISFELNGDFVDASIDHNQLKTLVESYQSGGISITTFLYNLQRGEILPPGTDIADEKKQIELQEEKRNAEAMKELEIDLDDDDDEDDL